MTFNVRVLRKRAEMLRTSYGALSAAELVIAESASHTGVLTDIAAAKIAIAKEVRLLQQLLIKEHKHILVVKKRLFRLPEASDYLFSISNIECRQNQAHFHALEDVNNIISSLVKQMIIDLRFKCNDCSSVYATAPQTCDVCGHQRFTSISLFDYYTAVKNQQQYEQEQRESADGLRALFG